MSETTTNATATLLRFTGAIEDLSCDDRASLVERSTSLDLAIRDRTAAIIADVRARGDEALRALALRFDDTRLESLEVPRAVWNRALQRTEPSVRRALERAATNIATTHRAFLPVASECEPEPGIVIGRRPDPLQRVGVYAPGGRAAYPSSVLMGAVPARVAGVGEVIVATPARSDAVSDGASDIVLAAAAIAGVDRVFAVGGAGAIAAMAFGTNSIPRVDRIVGPGNAYVAEAKLQVAGAVAIDSPAGPSELLVLCDGTSDPRAVAFEMLAQAEHAPDARVVAVTTDADSAVAIIHALTDALSLQPRATIAREALATHGAVLVARSFDEACAFATAYAPEHLLVLSETFDIARLLNAGTIFVGRSSSVTFGDYMSGANHVLPTGGLARSYSGLSILDFFRWTTYQRIAPDAAARLAPDVATFAEAEGLPGHAIAARLAGGLSR